MNNFFRIGALNISLEYESNLYEMSIDKAFEEFTVEPFETPDIRFRVDTKSPLPSLESCKQLFTTYPDGLWTLVEDSDKGNYVILLHHSIIDKEPYKKIITVDRTFSNFTIYSKPGEDSMIFPLDYPLDELAISAYLNINKIGIILHSASVSISGKGFLFSGVSGSGKSTISEIWSKDPEATVLTDEKVILRHIETDYFVFGTPWHNTAKVHKNAGVPIEKIFFIRHGKENKATPISNAAAVNRLMVRCFPTFWNRNGIQFALDFCSIMANKKDCFDLEFIDNLSIIEYLKVLFF